MSLKISVITVVKNGMPYLKESIKSFNQQNYKNKELIIVYSKSDDQTLKYINKNKKKNFKIIIDKIYKNKFGPLNIGIKKSTGDIIGILHSDDIYPKNNILKSVVSEFKSNNADVVYGNCLFCEKQNINKIVRFWKSKKFDKEDLKYGWMPPHTTIYVKKKIIINNLYSLKYKISGDYKFILDIFSKKLNFIFLNKNLILMRVGGDSTKIKNFIIKIIEDILISKKFFKHYIFAIFCKIFRKTNQLFVIKKKK